MDRQDIKLAVNILDAFECAKEALKLLPHLPPKIKPVYFRILNVIYQIRDETGSVRISDISKASGILLPNTTRLINELVKLNVVEKTCSDSDKRVVLVRTTALGEQYLQKHVLDVHKSLQDEFLKISESDRSTMIETIHKVYQAMKKVYQDNND
jgi:DNA-binding MarR family transcriptional regulator